MRFRTWSLLLPLASACSLDGCLPEDTRPEPGELSVTAEPSDAVVQGLDTSDGWHVVFERLLVSLGHVELDAEECSDYSEPRYDRLIDFARSQRQKLSVVYAIGACDMVFRISPVSTDDVLTAGVTEADRAYMRTDGTDPYASSGGATVVLRGHATNAAVSKTFDWAFRRSYEYHDCPGLLGASQTLVTLDKGVSATLPIVIHGEELFRAYASDVAPFRFAAIAGADSDGDGAVTLDELAQVPSPVEPPDGGVGVMLDSGAGADSGADSGAAVGSLEAGAPSLLGYVYEKLLTRLPHIGVGGACEGGPRSAGR